MLAYYLGVGGCWEEKCVSLLARCEWVSGGLCLLPTFMWVGVGRINVLASYVPRCGWVSGDEMC